MRRKTYFIFAFLIALLALTSCHGRKALPNFEIPDSFDEDREYNISFWAKNDSNPVQRRLYEQAIVDFNKYYPNIHVTVQHYSSYPDIYKAVISNIGTGTTPNIAITYPDHVATYLESNTSVVQLDDLINDGRYGLASKNIRFKSPSINEFVPEYINEGYLEINSIKSLYTLPFMRSVECMYINKTWLERNGFSLPKDNIFSWDYVWEIARAARNKSSKITPLIYQSEDNFFIQLCTQNGNPYTTNDGQILFSNDSNKQMVLDINSKFKEKLFSLKNNTGDYPGDKLNVEEAIFGIDSTAGSTWIGPECPLAPAEGHNFEVLVTTVPQVDVNNPITISQGPSLCIFNKADKQEVLASWIFMQYLLTNDVQISYAKTEGYSPVTNSAIESNEFQSFINDESTYYVQRQAIKNVIEYRSKSYVTPAFNGSALVRENVGKIMLKANVSYKKEIDVDELFKQALTDSGL